MAFMEKRLKKELQALIKDPPVGIHLDQESISSSLAEWVVELAGASGTLYEGETFKLRFKFGSRYPFDSPEVVFLGPNVPVHPHIYSNGHICLSILTDDWSPALSVQSVCLSIVSMLSSCREKKWPADNAFYVKTCNGNPKKTSWWYHGSAVFPMICSLYSADKSFNSKTGQSVWSNCSVQYSSEASSCTVPVNSYALCKAEVMTNIPQVNSC